MNDPNGPTQPADLICLVEGRPFIAPRPASSTTIWTVALVKPDPILASPELMIKVEDPYTRPRKLCKSEQPMIQNVWHSVSVTLNHPRSFSPNFVHFLKEAWLA